MHQLEWLRCCLALKDGTEPKECQEEVSQLKGYSHTKSNLLKVLF